jgi:uncharacterized membrane protein YbhN (UPF0104 family)
MLHLSAGQELIRLLRSLEPRWLILAAATQVATYYCAAGVWQVALVHERERVPLSRLLRLALVMLFANQAVPSAGLSGGTLVVRALRRQHVPVNIATGALLVGVLTTFLAFAVTVPVSVFVLQVHHAANRHLVLVVIASAAVGAAVTAGIAWFRRSMTPKMRARLTRLPGIGPLLKAVATAPAGLLRDPKVLGQALGLQLTEMTLDTSTLQVVMVALNVHVSPAVVLASYILASAVSQAVAVPMGLGSFDAVLVTVLHAADVPFEAAFAATLILRGFTFWLPMVPGLWLAHRELGPRTRAAAA